MKEVIFVILEGFADWEGAYIGYLFESGSQARKSY